MYINILSVPIQNPEQEKVRKNLPHKQAVVSLSPQEWKVQSCEYIKQYMK